MDATAIDPDGDSLTYSLQGNDAGSFTVDSSSGEVRFNESPDYESGKTSYEFTLTASDGELSDSVDVTVNVNDINDSPLFATDVVSDSVDENVSTSIVIFDADATDADGDELTYSLDPQEILSGVRELGSPVPLLSSSRPELSFGTDGNLFVVRQVMDADGDGWGIIGQLLDPRGTPIDAERVINTTSLADQINPDVEVLSSGNYVVTWNSFPSMDGYGQIVDQQGQPV
ncbi:MAG: cadherin repeat domain-containing protein, partial [Gammaproteobacteria bacterium]